MPREGISRREYRIKKFGAGSDPWNSTPRSPPPVRQRGIDFAFDKMERTPNTVDAHRLIWLADKQGIQDAVVEPLFRAYFTEARDISSRQNLIDVVAEAGLDRSKAEALLNSDEGMEALRESDELGRRFRVDGVPFFIVNGKITLGGAQQPEAFLEAFKKAIVST
jgi:predicted DsbA family dithiol-disulfide isomerase